MQKAKTHSSATLTLNASGRLALAGTVLPDQAPALRAEGEAHIRQAGGACQIDLSSLDNAHSVVLSLLLGWVRFAQRHRVAFHLHGVPDPLYEMMRVSGIASMMPLQDGAD